MEEHHSTGSCGCQSKMSSLYRETIDEMDFVRGVWTAALNGDVRQVKSYLEKDGDPNAVDTAGYTPLHYCSRSGHLDVCEVLLSQGASPNSQTRSGHVTPLHRAAYCGHVDVVNVLLKHGASPLMCDADGQTALHKAAEKGHKDIIELLVKSHSELINIKDKKGRIPFELIPQNRQDLLSLFTIPLSTQT